MALDAIKSITEAEEKARVARINAQAKANSAAEQAEADGRRAIAESEKQAHDEVRHMMREYDSKAGEAAKELASTTANRRAAMQAHAEARLDTAAKLIVERIVSG